MSNRVVKSSSTDSWPKRKGFWGLLENLKALKAPWYSHPDRLIIVSGCILATIVVGGTLILLSQLRERDLAEKTRELETLNFVLADQIDRSLQLIEVVQTSTVERMRHLGIATENDLQRLKSDYATHQYLKQKVDTLPYIDALVITDARGKLINFSRSWPIPTVKTPSHDPHEAFAADPQLTSFVGAPLRSPATGSWELPIARKLTAPDGTFLGVIIGVIRLDYFQKLFRHLMHTPGGSIALFLHDGTLLVRYPRSEAAIGKTFPNALFIKLLARSDHGTARPVGMFDGKKRIIAARRLAHYPIALVVTTTEAEALANWTSGAIATIVSALLIGLVIGGTVFLSIWVVGKKLREQGLQRDIALDNMSQGLLLFDKAERLVICNNRYRALYNLPANVAKPGCTLLDLLHYRVATGTFADDPEKYIRDLRTAIAKGQPAKRTVRARDERVVVVVNQPIKGGGWVATHEDITDKIRAQDATEEKKRQLDAALNNMSQGLCMFDANQRLIVCNGDYAHLYKLPEELTKPGTALRKILEYRVGAGNAPIDFSIKNRLDNVAGDRVRQIIDQLKDGRSIEIIHTPMDGGGWVSTHEDITERQKTEEALAHAHRELTEKQFAIDQAVNVVNTDLVGNITYVNEQFCQTTGYGRDELIGKNLRILNSGTHSNQFFHEMYKRITNGEVWRGELCNKTKNGSLYWIDATIIPQLGADGRPASYMSIRSDITARKLAEMKISFMAKHDALTGLDNRVAFNETLNEALARSRRDHAPFAVLLLDLDGFKNINDTLGHAAGDELLKEWANRLKSILREGDALARLGGDEFAIIQCAENNQQEAAATLALKLLEVAARALNIHGHEVTIGVSIGIALGPEDGSSPGELLQNADLALYRVKSDGRNQFRFFDKEMSSTATARLRLLNDLRAALNGDEFELHYQPIFDAKTLRPCCAEALVRWRHPVEGLIFPDRFIPLAEEAGLMGPLGAWILEKACADAAKWPEDIKVAINLSATQFRIDKLFDIILCALVESGLAPNRLEFEITESAVLQNTEHYGTLIQRLKNIGISIVLDDFGTGYSSLSYLTAFSFDKIKIDKSFTRDLTSRAECAAIVASVITLARGLDIVVTAEGIETGQQFDLLRVAGVQQMQGFMLARPCPVTELEFSTFEPEVRDIAVA